MEKFRYPKSLKWMLVCGIIVGLGMGALFLVFPVLDSIEPYPITYLAFSTPAALLFFWLAYRSWKDIPEVQKIFVVDDTGINCRTITGAEIRIDWNEVAQIRPRSFWRRLDLHGRTGGVLIRIGYQLTGFDRLQDIVIRRTAPYRVELPLGRAFQPPIWPRVFFLGFALLSAALGLKSSSDVDPRTPWSFAAFSVLSLIAFAWELKSVRVGPDAITIKNPIRSNEIRFVEIDNVAMRMVQQQQQAVVLERVGRQSIQLPFVQSGAVQLFEEIEKAWRAYKGGTVPEPTVLEAIATEDRVRLVRRSPVLWTVIHLPALSIGSVGYLKWRSVPINLGLVIHPPNGQALFSLVLLLGMVLGLLLLARRHSRLDNFDGRFMNRFWTWLVTGSIVPVLGAYYLETGEATFLVLSLLVIIVVTLRFDLPDPRQVKSSAPTAVH